MAAGACAGLPTGSPRLVLASGIGTGVITSIVATFFGLADGIVVSQGTAFLAPSQMVLVS